MITFRLKELIKRYGSQSAIPKRKKRGSNDEEVDDSKPTKGTYISNLIDVMRQNELFANDYQKVAVALQEELLAVKNKKGFGAKKTSDDKKDQI
jgi:hypothetical protein